MRDHGTILPPRTVRRIFLWNLLPRVRRQESEGPEVR